MLCRFKRTHLRIRCTRIQTWQCTRWPTSRRSRQSTARARRTSSPQHTSEARHLERRRTRCTHGRASFVPTLPWIGEPTEAQRAILRRGRTRRRACGARSQAAYLHQTGRGLFAAAAAAPRTGGEGGEMPNECTLTAFVQIRTNPADRHSALLCTTLWEGRRARCADERRVARVQRARCGSVRQSH